jgi:outer membrane protein OmpA-like peptidoglycan-associated protein
MSTHARRHLFLVASLLVALCAGVAAAAERPDPERDRLVAELAALDAEPALADLAGLERLKARQALARLQVAKSRQREQALFLAQRWIAAAVDAANAELLERQAEQLDRERDQIVIEASRRDAERARRDAELLRLQTLVREEEAAQLAESGRLASEQSAAEVEAATKEAAQANRLAEARAREVELARKEAELAAAVAAQVDTGPAKPAGPAGLPPSRRVGGKTVYTLDGDVFPVGSAQLTARGIDSLRALAGAVPAGRKLRIEAFTDAQGADDANRLLSQRRADAVRRALAAAGIAASRLDATGRGEAAPIADNGTAAGRARNRRVEITVE